MYSICVTILHVVIITADGLLVVQTRAQFLEVKTQTQTQTQG